MSARETYEFKRGYQLVVMEAQRQIVLGNIDVHVVKNKEAINKSSTSRPKSIPFPKDPSMSVAEPKGKEKKDDNMKSSDQGQTYFSLEPEIAKIRIFVPLTKLLKIS